MEDAGLHRQQLARVGQRCPHRGGHLGSSSNALWRRFMRVASWRRLTCGRAVARVASQLTLEVRKTKGMGFPLVLTLEEGRSNGGFTSLAQIVTEW